MAADKYRAQSLGIEIDFLRVLWSRLAIKRKGLKDHVKVIRVNFFKTSLEKATVVTLYQCVSVNKKLREKLLNELKPGTRVVSHNFRFQGWTPTEVDEVASNYLYIL